MTHETEISADPKVPIIRIAREFDAPPAAVFRAHADAALFAQWLGPRDLEMRIDHFDCRTGGAYRITMTGDIEGTVHGSFHDVIPNELIVQTFTPDVVPDLVVLEKHRFEDLDDGRSRIIATSLVENFEYRDSFLTAGLLEGYEKLDQLLEEL